MAFFRRLLIVFIGYMLAVIAATLGMTGLSIVENFSASPLRALDWRGLSAILITYGTLIATYAFVPVAIAIAIAEWCVIRSLPAHLFAGAVVGFVSTGTLGRFWPAFNPLGMPPQGLADIMLVAAAGIVAALVYWLVAGREAGSWR
jgi:hypothetical protein